MRDSRSAGIGSAVVNTRRGLTRPVAILYECDEAVVGPDASWNNRERPAGTEPTGRIGLRRDSQTRATPSAARTRCWPRPTARGGAQTHRASLAHRLKSAFEAFGFWSSNTAALTARSVSCAIASRNRRRDLSGRLPERLTRLLSIRHAIPNARQTLCRPNPPGPAAQRSRPTRQDASPRQGPRPFDPMQSSPTS